jgi:hypothetical protein
MDPQLLNEVVMNVTRLYHGANRQEQAAANRWLMQFQRENSAWEVAASVLSFVQGLDEKRPELHLFAAQTLRKKVSPCWDRGYGAGTSGRSSMHQPLCT